MEKETERQASMSQVMSQILKAQEAERKRIARELHDDIIQTLIAIANRIQNYASKDCESNEENINSEMIWATNSIIALSEDVRRICLDLSPKILDDFGLVPSLSWLVNSFNSSGNSTAAIEITGSEHKLSPEIEINLFRIVQESLNNISRHANASTVSVKIEFNLETVKISIQDNGKGFSMKDIVDDLSKAGKLGLISMQQRAQLLNGILDISSQPGKGTRISIEAKS
ncbi:MAG: sensor histidine kinase [Dehalococcoidales bacterium]|nr:sensor histidine kinase [Dehalococcoidales bacterium]